MKDNNEGGSRETGSARQNSSQTDTPTNAGQAVTGAAIAGGDTGHETELRPVSADMQQFIGRQLRAVFDDVAKQPVPDRFLELMRQLDSKTGA